MVPRSLIIKQSAHGLRIWLLNRSESVMQGQFSIYEIAISPSFDASEPSSSWSSSSLHPPIMASLKDAFWGTGTVPLPPLLPLRRLYLLCTTRHEIFLFLRSPSQLIALSKFKLFLFCKSIREVFFLQGLKKLSNHHLLLLCDTLFES